MLRWEGFHDLAEIEEAVLESDGFISVTKKSEIPEDYDFQRNDVY